MRKNLFGRARLFLTHLTVDRQSRAAREIRRDTALMDLALYESVLRDDTLPRIPKQVLLYLTFRCRNDYSCYPTQTTIAKQLKYTRVHISKAICWLRDSGKILTKPNGRKLVYDLSPYVTCHQRLQQMPPQVTGTGNQRLHRTRSELANERIDSTGRYKISVDGTRQYY